jgi:inorganic pyrophosphatase
MEPPTHFIGTTVTIKIDRPLGSRHPRWGFVYPVNYGYLPGVPAPDGEDLDAYLLGIFEPVETFTGICIAVIHRLDDDDDKLVVVPSGVDYTKGQIRALTEFQERFFQSEVLRSEERRATSQTSW